MNTSDIIFPLEEKNDKPLIGHFIFDYKNKILYSENVSQKLTQKEADLLKLLYENKNKILTREFLLNTIWGKNDYFIGRSMDVYITRLRKYIRCDSNISISNIRSIGYKFIAKTIR